MLNLSCQPNPSEANVRPLTRSQKMPMQRGSGVYSELNKQKMHKGCREIIKKCLQSTEFGLRPKSLKFCHFFDDKVPLVKLENCVDSLHFKHEPFRLTHQKFFSFYPKLTSPSQSASPSPARWPSTLTTTPERPSSYACVCNKPTMIDFFTLNYFLLL